MYTLRSDKRMQVTKYDTLKLADANSKAAVKRLTGTTILKISASKQRKRHQAEIKRIIEAKTDTLIQNSLGKDSKKFKHIAERLKTIQRIGKFTYASDGVTIDAQNSFY